MKPKLMPITLGKRDSREAYAQASLTHYAVSDMAQFTGEEATFSLNFLPYVAVKHPKSIKQSILASF